MASAAAHSLTCEVVHASVAGVHWHSCASFANPHVCGACIEPVCSTLPPLLVWTLVSLLLELSSGSPGAAGGARAPVLVMALVACLVPHWRSIALCSVACLRSWGL